MPKAIELSLDENFISDWDKIHDLRDVVKKQLENAVKEKLIKASLEAKITLTASGSEFEFIKSVENELAAAFIVSAVEVVAGEGELKVDVQKARGEKCERCWAFSETVGECSEHPTLCARCAEVLK